MGFSIRACLLQLLLVLLAATTPAPTAAQSRPPSPGRILDAALQDYAYQALARRPARTGTIYNATLPVNLTGMAVSAVRLRSGSLRRKGFAAGGYFQFGVPTGVVVQPYVERVVLVYHDLGDRSDYYYPLPAGYTYIAPILGLLVYDAANLSAVGLQELDVVVATGRPISVSFGGSVRAVPAGSVAPRCVVFGLDGVLEFMDLEEETGDVCSTYRQGHVSIVVNSSGIASAAAPPSGAIAPPIPTAGGNKKGSSKAWKIAISVAGAAIALGFLAVLLLCLVRCKRDKKLEVMERNSKVGETLRMAQVGRTQAPVALGTRTQPLIENEYTA